MATIRLLKGDCLQKLKELEDNSIDSVVTDPPYEIGFMGKGWDDSGIANNPELWKEVLRVLKPGGHLLSFSHSRTYHRQAVGIEDAGFEIRDQIMWIYGSGFPKSHNIGKALDKNNGNGDLVYEVAEKLKEARESRGITKTQADKLFCDGSTNYSWLEGRKDGVRLPEDDLFQKIVDEWPELQPYQQKVKSANREIIGKYDSDMGGLGGERLGSKGGDISLPATPIAKQYEGWGTALKPAHEPIVMARKPFKGTVADNVLEWGTGGINVDGCRIGYEDTPNPATNPKYRHEQNYKMPEKGQESKGAVSFSSSNNDVNVEGRFPANIIFECTCENPIVKDNDKEPYNYKDNEYQVEGFIKGVKPNSPSNYNDTKGGVIHTDPNCPCYILDQQSGTTKSSKRGAHNNKKTEHTNTYTPPQAMYSSNNTHGDTGGASRFFYCPKASKKDRNEGMEHIQPTSNGKIGTTFAGNQTTSKIGANPNKPTEPQQNVHPTVKPTALMAYLIRLVTPKGGVVLDPFMGSGSTGKACVREGMNFIGIERETEYMEIAKTRIEHEQKKNNHTKFFDI
jgi:DNA modification methylase